MASRVIEETDSFTWEGTAGIGRGDCRLFLAAETLPLTASVDDRPIDVKVTLQTFLRLDLPVRNLGGRALTGPYFFKLPAPPGPVRCDLDILWMLFAHTSGLPELITGKITAFRAAAVAKALRRGGFVTRVVAEFEHVRRVQVSEVSKRRRRRDQAAPAPLKIELEAGEETFCHECIEEVGERDWGEAVKLDCDHVFHVGCIHRWLQARFSCPFCGTRPTPLRSSEMFPRDGGSAVGYLMREENGRDDGGGGWCRKLLPALKMPPSKYQ